MKRYMKYLVCSSLYFTMGCSDFLDVETPKNQIDTQMVFNDERTANSAMMNVYASIRNTGFLSGNREGIGSLLGAYTDELEVVATQSIGVRYFYELNVQPTNTSVKNLWDNTYKQIYMVNQMIAGINNAEGLTAETKNQLVGESLGIRGILHFYLSQTFGAVPYVTGIDYQVNKKIEKQGETQVLQLAVADLIQAHVLLETGAQSDGKTRVNTTVVNAFLARMYLYQQNWVKASEYAQLIIDDNRLQMEPLASVFLKGSNSAIWQLKPEIEGRNTLEGENYIFTALPAPVMKLHNSLVNVFETGDLRKSAWIGTVDADNHYAFKYKQRGMTAGGTLEYSVIVRLEEMYLIKAEAAAQMSDFYTCNAMLNSLRVRAGLPALDMSDKTTAVDAVLNERRRELFCELGHRFYDLKRYGKLDAVKEEKPNWQPFYSLLPLPLNELTLNPNLLPQNEGY